jgi:hypothetical protein
VFSGGGRWVIYIGKSGRVSDLNRLGLGFMFPYPVDLELIEPA